MIAPPPLPPHDGLPSPPLILRAMDNPLLASFVAEERSSREDKGTATESRKPRETRRTPDYGPRHCQPHGSPHHPKESHSPPVLAPRTGTIEP